MFPGEAGGPPFVRETRVARMGRAEPHARRANHRGVCGAFVAFDVAKTEHAVAVADAGRAGEVRFLGEVENTPARIERTIKKLAARYGRLQVCFEAGPTGYGLYRQIQELGHDC